jgi:hypothetical protein
MKKLFPGYQHVPKEILPIAQMTDMVCPLDGRRGVISPYKYRKPDL